MKKGRKNMPTYAEILGMEPKELVMWLSNTFYVNLPLKILTAEEMYNASELLMILTNQYSYLNELLSYAKIVTREVKRDCDKETYEDMVDRKNAIENKLSIVKQQYNSLSRLVTIKIETNKELMMDRSI